KPRSGARSWSSRGIPPSCRTRPWQALLSGPRPASGLELVGGHHGLRNGDVRFPGPAHGPDEGVQFGVGEELAELLDRLPLVDEDDEAVDDAETVVNRAVGAGILGELLGLGRPPRQRRG